MNRNPQEPIVIIGAGPAGLGAAYRLHSLGRHDWVLFERQDHVGGLSASFNDDRGFTWDLGGHVVFSHYDLFTRLLDGLLGDDGWFIHDRESWVRLLDRWLPYPFQSNLHYLPPELRAHCLEGLINAALHRGGRSFANFEDFILGTFGQGIAELFMLPYNSKVWAFPPAQLSASWVGDRVAIPDPVRAVRQTVLKEDHLSWGPNNRFRFPKHGGTGAIWQALAQRLPREQLLTGCEVIALDPDAREITLVDGRRQPFRWLISTMPLDLLASMSGRQEWKSLAAGLLHSSVHVIGIALKGRPSPELASKCWMYFPENNTPFYRVTHFSHYSPYNVDDISRSWSLMCEVSESNWKPVDQAKVVQDTLDGLLANGLVSQRDEVVHTWHRRLEYAYPTPGLARDGVLRQLLPELAKYGILSRGRFGAWRYEVGNMDHSFMQGLEAASYILHDSPELTIWYPDVVNNPHPSW